MSIPTLESLKDCFDSATWQRGCGYHRTGRATVTDVSENGTTIKGQVSGSARRPYHTTLTLTRTRSGRLSVASACTCPVVSSCKHAVALLLQARDDGVLRLPEDTLGTTATPAFAGLSADEAVSGARGTGRLQPPLPAGGLSVAPPVADWLERLETASKAASEAYPDSVRHRLIYCLSSTVDAHGDGVTRVSPVSVRLNKDGTFGRKVTEFNPASAAGWGGPLFLRPSDRSILGRLSFGTGTHTLQGGPGARVLADMIATGRCHWQSVSGPIVEQGAPRPGRITWVLRPDACQVPRVEPADRPTLEAEEGSVVAMLSVVPPWVVTANPARPDRMTALPLTLDMPPLLLETLLKAPPLPLDQVPGVRDRLPSVLGPLAPDSASAGDLLPKTVAQPRRVSEALVPVLRLFSVELQPLPWPSYSRKRPEMPEPFPAARLTYRYGDAEIPPSPGVTRERSVVRMTASGPVEVVRSIKKEDELFRSLTRLGFTRFRNCHDLTVDADHQDDLALGSYRSAEEHWLRFLLDDAPDLQRQGWVIEIGEDFPIRPIVVEDAFDVVVSEDSDGSGIDWFDLSLGVMVEGRRVDVLPALLTLIQDLPEDDFWDILEDDTDDTAPLSLRLADGTIIVVPFGRVRPILQALADLMASGAAPGTDDQLRLSSLDAPDLARFEEAVGSAGVPIQGGEAMRTLGQRLRDAHGAAPQVSLPATFHGTLRPYQAVGVAWMQLLREVGLGGILADDMGLGKTIQALAHLSIEQAAGRLTRPSLVIAPTSLMGNWKAEAAQFAPQLRTLVLQGPDRKAHFGHLADYDLVFSTYPLLTHDAEVLIPQDWYLLILDEAQTVKNPATAAAKTLRQMTACHRLGLTGTPVENNLGELWALFDVISPGLLGDRKGFTKTWRTPIEKQGDTDQQARLSRRLRPFLLRRTKGEVLKDLPPRTDIMDRVTLTDAQRAVYEGIRLAMHSKVRDAIARKGLARSHIELLEALLRLRQVCCDPRLVAGARGVPAAKKAARAGSAKLDRLMDMLPEMINEGRRVLLFSQFTSMLDLIEAEVRAREIPYAMLTGKTKDRTGAVARFQSEQVPVFLVSLKAGGTGLNLTAADTVIHYDPWWNPAVEQQATDRAHRIGQDKAVFVYKLVAEDTIEVKMQALKERKQALADGLFDPDGATPFDISEDDVEFLLGDV